MKNKKALIIFAKTPHRNHVKTRLIGHLSEEQRLNLYISLLSNTINRLKDIKGVDTYISYSPANRDSYFTKYSLRIFPQSKGDIGDRMFNAIREILNKGYEKAVLVGVDIPDISASIVLKAFDLLSHHDIVFGPARDGGYYLVGLKTPIMEIFRDIQWSTKQTLKQSIENAESLDCSIAFTEILSDIDTIEDVRQAGFICRNDTY